VAVDEAYSLATELQAARSDGGYRVGMVGQNMAGARIEGGDFLFVEADETPPEGVVSSPYSGAGQR
jgi:hypothetical protein